MYAALGSPSNLQLVAVGVVIWIVAMSVAFGFYISVLRERKPRIGPRRSAEFVVASAAIVDADRPATSAAEVLPPKAEPPAPVAAAAPCAPPVLCAPIRPEQPEPSAGFSVLIVDDNAINRQVFELILDSIGLAHVSVENGAEAVEAVSARAFDAVLMDIQMPVMDGFEATRRIRALEAERGDPASPIIIVSANCMDEHVAVGRAAGADAHLPKPVSAMALIRTLQTCAFSDQLAA